MSEDEVTGKAQEEELSEEREAGAVDESQEEGDDAEQEHSSRRRPVRRIDRASDLLGEEICYRAQSLSARLKPHLTGTVLLKINDSRYRFSWTSSDVKCEKVESDEGDCVMEMREDDFVSVANGRLNPQIALLSHKVKLTGKTELAIYFFNLVTSQ